MLNRRFDESFRQLLKSWENHRRTAQSGSVRDLAIARADLDRARLEAAQVRRIFT